MIINITRPTLYHTEKLISNMSPDRIGNITRLKKAAELLAEGNYKIYKVADLAGFALQTYFERNLKQFGITPLGYILKNTNAKL